jgi:hypothetical protein
MLALRVRSCVDSEDAAKNILANFGRISTATQPIVLCYDQLDNIPRLADGSQDFQALFDINTTIHNDPLKNFLVVISVITNTWRQTVNRIQAGDQARIDCELRLKRIDLTQAKALWSYHLSTLHQSADPKPATALSPLTDSLLETAFPGGKTTTRAALTLGQREYQAYKQRLISPIRPPIKPPAKRLGSLPADPPPIPHVRSSESEFQLLWQQEQRKTEGRITKITLCSAPDLLQMLREALSMLGISQIQPKLLSGRFSSYSCSYIHPNSSNSIGLVWTEDSSMTAF